jgi:alpha-ketoglutaric semialdehyde dehydrogenase
MSTALQNDRVDLATIPSVIPNQIGHQDAHASDSRTFSKVDPATGRPLCQVARSTAADVQRAVEAASNAQPAWAAMTPVKRGDILRQIAMLMREHRAAIADLVARETGKSRKDALGETDAAIEMGFFVAGEGRRFYGQTTTSAVPNKSAMVIRQPLGVAGLIIAANTPIANVAWKAFPALLCGNAAVLKASEDTPLSAWAFGVLAREAGVPDGVYTTLHGFGEEAGAPLVEHPDVAVISFTGSCEVGRWIAQTAGKRLAKTCLELGGKNPLIVCDDADLQNAVTWTIGSAFSNAGQRCAAGSRILVFDAVYDRFRQMLTEAVGRLKVGTADTDDYGPVINEEQMKNMLGSVARAKAAGGPDRRPTADRRPLRRRVLRGADHHRTRRIERRDLAHRAVRPDHHPLPRERLRGSDRHGQRLSVRPHRVDSHAEHQPGDDLHRPHPGRSGGGQRRHLRQRAAPAVRRAPAVGQRLARSRYAGARRLFRPEDGVHQPRSGKDLNGSNRT